MRIKIGSQSVIIYVGISQQMCRMFLLQGDFVKDFPDIFRCFQMASHRDPFPDPESNYSYLSHKDGWGYTNVSGTEISYFRSSQPVFESHLPKLKAGTVLMHSRKTSDDQPSGVANNHPFTYSNGRKQVFLAHNGWFDKNTLILQDTNFAADLVTDSEAFMYYLAENSQFEYEPLQARFGSLEAEGVDFALANVFITTLEKNTSGGSTQSFYYTEKGKRGGEYDEFDRLYYIESDLWRGVFSSSIVHFENFPDNVSKVEVPRGKLLVL